MYMPGLSPRLPEDTLPPLPSLHKVACYNPPSITRVDFCQACDMFPVDMGIDVGPLQERINQCKRRYHRELWQILCDYAVQQQQEDSGNRGKDRRDSQHKRSSWVKRNSRRKNDSQRKRKSAVGSFGQQGAGFVDEEAKEAKPSQSRKSIIKTVDKKKSKKPVKKFNDDDDDDEQVEEDEDEYEEDEDSVDNDKEKNEDDKKMPNPKSILKDKKKKKVNGGQRRKPNTSTGRVPRTSNNDSLATSEEDIPLSRRSKIMQTLTNVTPSSDKAKARYEWKSREGCGGERSISFSEIELTPIEKQRNKHHTKPEHVHHNTSIDEERRRNGKTSLTNSSTATSASTAEAKPLEKKSASSVTKSRRTSSSRNLQPQTLEFTLIANPIMPPELLNPRGDTIFRTSTLTATATNSQHVFNDSSFVPIHCGDWPRSNEVQSKTDQPPLTLSPPALWLQNSGRRRVAGRNQLSLLDEVTGSRGRSTKIRT